MAAVLESLMLPEVPSGWIDVSPKDSKTKQYRSTTRSEVVLKLWDSARRTIVDHAVPVPAGSLLTIVPFVKTAFGNRLRLYRISVAPMDPHPSTPPSDATTGLEAPATYTSPSVGSRLLGGRA